MLLNVRTAWGHWRHTSSDLFGGRHRSTLYLGAPLCVDDPAAGGGGGGTGGDGSGDGKGKEGDGGAGTGGGSGEGDAGKKAEQDKKLAAEAAGWRTKLRDTEKQFTDFKSAAETQIAALQSQIAEIESRGNANPQGDGKGNGGGTAKPDPELVKLQRTVKELSDNLRVERDNRVKQESQLKQEKIRGRINELVSAGGFQFPKILARGLSERVDIAADGAIVLKVPNEVGGTDDVPATLENLLKHKPVDDFDSFLPSAGSGGSGGTGGNKGASDDGIDWAKVKAGDLDYIGANQAKINAALQRQNR